MFVEVLSSFMDSEKGCVGLQLSEVTKNKTLKQTDL